MKTLAFILCLLPAISAAADDPKQPPPQKDTLQAVLDRIKQHASGNAWKQPGFKDEAIEAWLDKLVGSIAKAADFPDLQLPVRQKDVKAIGPPQPNNYEQALIVGKDLDLTQYNLTRCVVLADGNVEVLTATDSIIIARGVIGINNFSAGSVIAAGTLVRGGDFDGKAPDTANGSVIVSRGWVEIGKTYGTLVAAGVGIVTTEMTPKNLWCINAPAPAERINAFGPQRSSGNRSISVPNLPLEALPLHPLGEKLKVLGVMHSRVQVRQRALTRTADRYQPTGVVLEFEGRRLMAELGLPIADEAGQIVSALRGWRVSSVSDKLVILSGAEADAFVRF